MNTPALDAALENAERIHDAERLCARLCRELGLVAVRAAHRPQVVVVDGREQHPDAHLARGGLGERALLDGEHLGRVAEFVVDESFHDQSSETVICTSMFPRVALE